jgi:hypothetical protein
MFPEVERWPDDALDEAHETIECPACYTHGKGDRLEYCNMAGCDFFSDDYESEAPKIISSALAEGARKLSNLRGYPEENHKSVCRPGGYLNRAQRNL